VNKTLVKIQQLKPQVTVLVAGYNGEENKLRCTSSLSKMKTSISLEIVVVKYNTKKYNANIGTVAH